MELLHQPGEIIADRYRIIDTLGQGGIGITYQAQDLQTEQLVALKALSLRRMADWKVLELFEREARILSQLNHVAIPRYLDYFQVDTGSDPPRAAALRYRGFYIAQQLALGKSLAVLVENGWIPDETELQSIAFQVLEILRYLHNLTPPVIHRDIKPQNIILQSNGQVFLVDFGAVQDTYHNTVTGGSTVVGTYGYMAPEQFRGQAVLSTDLYGLGTTLLFLLTQKSPADLPQRKLKIDFRNHVCVSKEFADWLDKMLEPVIKNRFPSAEAALAVLRGKEALASYSYYIPPKDSPINLTVTEEQLVIEIPPVGLRTKISRRFGLITLVWNALFLPLLWGLDIVEFMFTAQGIFFLSCGLFGLAMLLYFILSSASSIRLTINQKNFRLKQSLLGWCLQDIEASKPTIVLGKWAVTDRLTVCRLRVRLSKYDFGSFLTNAEKEWLVREITDFLFPGLTRFPTDRWLG